MIGNRLPYQTYAKKQPDAVGNFDARGDSEKVLQVGGSESLYDIIFFIFPYRFNAPPSKTENRRSLAAFYPKLFNLQPSALFIEMDSSGHNVSRNSRLGNQDEIK